jgi:hypothetical protein
MGSGADALLSSRVDPEDEPGWVPDPQLANRQSEQAIATAIKAFFMGISFYMLVRRG